MHGISICLSCGAAAIACYLWGSSIKGRADYFNSITRVIDLKRLDDLLKEKTTNLLVVVSGRVASAAPFKSNDSGPLDVVFELKAKGDFETKLEDGVPLSKSINFLFQQNQTPFYLEDSTGRVNVVGAEDAIGFEATLQEYADMHLLGSIFEPKEGSKVCIGAALNTGTSLTFVGEAVRDKAGNLMIQKPSTEHPFMVFKGEGSFDTMVEKLKSDSEFYIYCCKIFGGIVVAIAVMYGVDFIKRWKKKNFGNKRPKNAKSDNKGTDISHL